MAKTKKARAPRIVGVVRHNGKAYEAGQEAALAKLITPGDVANLLAVGTIRGDWDVGVPAPTPAKK